MVSPRGSGLACRSPGDLVPGAVEPLYARIDLIDDAGGTPVVLELELAEPSLFLPQAEAASMQGDLGDGSVVAFVKVDGRGNAALVRVGAA